MRWSHKPVLSGGLLSIILTALNNFNAILLNLHKRDYCWDAKNARHENVPQTCREVKMQDWKMWRKLAGDRKCRNGKGDKKSIEYGMSNNFCGLTLRSNW